MISLIKAAAAIRWIRCGVGLSALLICLGAGQTASAQTTSSQPGSGRTFRVVSLAGEIPGLYVNPASPTQIRAASRFITGPYRRTANPLQFFSRDETTGVLAPLAVAVIPPGIRQPLVVFNNIPQRLEDGTELPYSTVVLDDASRRFPLNSVRFFNTAAFPLAVRFAGESPFVLQPGQSHVVSYGALSANSLKAVQLAGMDESGQWQRIGAGDVLLRRNNRHLLFLSPKSLDPVEELGPRELVIVMDAAGRIPAPLADEDDSE